LEEKLVKIWEEFALFIHLYIIKNIFMSRGGGLGMGGGWGGGNCNKLGMNYIGNK
jgi:preprotein translocase subunit SecG